MSDPFVGEIRAWGFNWAPRGWAFCNGQTLNIQQNAALYSLLGTQFGGDGKTTFGLPDLRGRAPQATRNPGYQQGSQYAGGSETVALTAAQAPVHNHALQAIAEAGDQKNPSGNFNSKVTAVSPATAPVNMYGAAGNLTALHPGTLSPVGAGAAHDNMQPSLVLNYLIATMGIYPMRP